jgi:hypothetical protein
MRHVEFIRLTSRGGSGLPLGRRNIEIDYRINDLRLNRKDLAGFTAGVKTQYE